MEKDILDAMEIELIKAGRIPGPPTPPLSRTVQECDVASWISTYPHYHMDERGFLVKCYANCRTLLMNWQFWAGLTLGFPVEHLVWEKLWPFSLVTKLFGL